MINLVNPPANLTFFFIFLGIILNEDISYSNKSFEQKDRSQFFYKESSYTRIFYDNDLNVLWDQELEKSLNQLPLKTKTKIIQKKEIFLKLLEKWREQPAHISRFVDKTHLLSEFFIPNDLVVLTPSKELCIYRHKLKISAFIVNSLNHMIKAAAKDNVTLCIASGYRNYNYQKYLHAQWIKKLGFTMAKKLSAPAGSSQHQLGSVIDFYPVNKNFTNSQSDLWLKKHAHNYGFSLSFPQNDEHITGYLHESWHYRYIGIVGCTLQNTFFQGSQTQFLQWSASWCRHIV